MKEKILIFSDCIVYSGSENVIENILLSPALNEKFDVHFLYAYNERYHLRFKERAEQFRIDVKNVSFIKLLNQEPYIYTYNLENTWNIKKIILFFKIVFLKVLKILFLSHIINFFLLKRRIKKYHIDKVYINNGGYPASLLCCLTVFVCKSIGIEYIYFNINNMAISRSRWYEKLMDKYISRYVNDFVTASFAAQNHAVSLRGLDKNKFSRIPNTIYKDKELIKKYNFLNYEHEKIIFGSVGLLTERKGYHVLLEAVNHIVNDLNIRNVDFRIIGDGEERIKLEKRIIELKLHNNFHLLGFLPNPLDEMSKFDAFVLPSTRNEDFPYVILEAMLLSKPVIGTNVAGIPEQVIDGVNGFIVQPSNHQELSLKLLKFIALNKKEVEIMGNESLNIYDKEFNFEKWEKMSVDLFSLKH